MLQLDVIDVVAFPLRFDNPHRNGGVFQVLFVEGKNNLFASKLYIILRHKLYLSSVYTSFLPSVWYGSCHTALGSVVDPKLSFL
jgi:hypothetical protein